MYVCVPHKGLVPRRPEDGIRFPEAGATDSCQLSHGCWESNLGSLEEQTVLSTAEAFNQTLVLRQHVTLQADWCGLRLPCSSTPFSAARFTGLLPQAYLLFYFNILKCFILCLVFSAYIYVHHMHMQCPGRPEEEPQELGSQRGESCRVSSANPWSCRSSCCS